MTGKGSAPRPYSVPKESFDQNFERIFGKKESELICPRCKVDRFKVPCPGPMHMCPIAGEAQCPKT